MRSFKYVTVFTLPAISFFSIHQEGWLTFLPLLYAFAFIPLVELLIRPDKSNLSQKEESEFLDNVSFDVILYVSAIAHLGFFIYFFAYAYTGNESFTTLLGKTISLGIMCGVFGINIAHELGHRKTNYERIFAKILLLASLYMHFSIEHNRGHHRHVSTEKDPASAPRNMPLYIFWIKSIIGSFFSAWRIENNRIQKKKLSFWHNEMFGFQIIQLALIVCIGTIYGLTALMIFLFAAVIGILLLETVNYIEHYGLRRVRLENGNYERVLPRHSWNSDHLLGRLMLFELSRHSDHHYLASRKYQILRHHEDSPQLPTGYPGMMILSLIPPLWFVIMHKRMDGFPEKGNA